MEDYFWLVWKWYLEGVEGVWREGFWSKGGDERPLGTRYVTKYEITKSIK